MGSWSSSEESEGEGPASSEAKAGASKGTEVTERRFRSMNSGAKHVVFIKCSPEINPTELVHSMLSDIHTTKIRKSRWPVTNTWYSEICA